jgi:4-amino-4-deoxy-L-arabinose transferase-like glycosyltransferase
MFFALSRLLHVDAMMSVMMLLSVLGYLGYLYRHRKWYFLALSGAAAGLAWLTKSPSYFLLPFMGLLALIDLIQARKRSAAAEGGPSPWVKLVWKAAAPLAVWLVIAAAVFVLQLPAMWVAPLDTLKSILSQASVYALEGHENVTFFNGQVYPVGKSAWYFYPISYLWRITPIVLVGLGLALVALLWRKRLKLSSQQVGVVGSLISFALLFMLGMSLGEKKFDRYLLPTHLALDLVAGFGWVILIQALAERYTRSWSANGRRLAVLAAYLVLIGGQISGVVSTYPYYFNYFNPLLGGSRKAQEVMMVGWGEGLDQAGRYLNTVQDAEKARVISFYGDGPLSYFFVGDTVGMDVDTKLSYLRKADYVVFYINQWQRKLPSQAVLDYFEKLTPVFVARVGGLDFARVYDMRNAPAPE